MSKNSEVKEQKPKRYERLQGKEWDLESLPAWKIEFEDGHKMSAYPEEIYLNDMIANGYEPETKK